MKRKSWEEQKTENRVIETLLREEGVLFDLDGILAAVRMHLTPREVFDPEDLYEWAVEEGLIDEETL
jgi:hypothetical protein